MIKSKYFRADKIEYKDGVNVCFWVPFKKKGTTEEMGICFDLPADHINDLIELLLKVKDAPAEKVDNE